MRRSILMVCVSLLAVLLAGCAQTPSASVYQPTLLFDRIPSTFSADRYAVRSGWLTTPAHIDEGQQIFYRELFYDQQGDRFTSRDYVSRRFIVVREGRGRR